MLLCRQMITGFNTDVRYEGNIYHVQTEDRGQDNPFLESLVYIGGTIVAKKSTPYSQQLSNGATEEMIASLLKRQHQVIIEAIKAGRIEDLIRHSAKAESLKEPKPKQSKPRSPSGKFPAPRAEQPQPALQSLPPVPVEREAPKGRTAPLGSPAFLKELTQPKKPANFEAPSTGSSNQSSNVAGLDLDQVISDYLKRNSEQGKLDLKVITPSHFISGKNIGLRE